MTASGHEERVQESGVVGHSYGTDDRLEDLDIYEALINPHEGQGGAQKKSGGGAPAMMPMGNTGSASKAETSAPTGMPTAGSAKGTSAASAGSGNASGFSGTGGASASGVGGAGYASAGLGAAALPGAGGTGAAGLGGLSSGLGTGGLGSGAGSSWTYPSYGTGAAGLLDPTLDQPGTTPTGGFTSPSLATPPTSTVPTPTVPFPTVPGTTGRIPPIQVPSVSSPGTSGFTVPSAGGAGGAASANTADLGVKAVQASPEMLHKEAQHWDETARDFTANVAHPVGSQSPSSVDFGMMADAFSPYNDLLNRLKKWSTDAGVEFSAISDALQSASGGYKDTEDTNTAASTQVQTHLRIPV